MIGVYISAKMSACGHGRTKKIIMAYTNGICYAAILTGHLQRGAVKSAQSVRKLNPDYVAPNPDNAEGEPEDEGYSPRADRAEWNLIGMLGQVQIKANEPTNPRWIKMKDISDAVELWMIR